MTLDQLQVLQTIVKSGSFRAASQELHRAQSAVSYAMRTLEDELGFKIFNRDQYRPELTPQGRAFLKKTDDLIFQFDEVKETAEFLKRGYEPEIRLAVSLLWPLPKLTSMLKEFTQKFPQTEIKIINDVLSNDEQLLEDHADIALGAIFNEKGLLVTEELFKVNMVPVCSAKHPLAKIKKPKPEQLSEYPQIILRSTVKNSNRSQGILNPHKVISVQDFLTKKCFLEAGLGWGLMPDHLVKEEIKQKSLVPLEAKPIKETLNIARHSAKDLGPCGKFIWDYFSNRQKKPTQ
ncbi:LysR family transcriptional regulator [Bdellovibrio svalbardensis]|uniref:LysR family transcriptional regulator n=1 Tax=Bdellovibrio svalbardensis TaxID=2972972 RepID=A0ABT6DGB7_9BACT|nr:LysR family transcriptional regulator [Bdellovibrio svalbardensis]MDG0815522.1 LysR family transcriptional regulator [Bdellovibrio svalbardensis]